ncbi:MAG TPA: glycoside hydrolase family 3 protein [Gaiellaceae bacterium]|nr:glycoside hydrolase family 3 protein [Gaiellaceae bacterium]
MTRLERLALGVLLPSFTGPEAPDWALRRLDQGLGGITLFADNVVDDEQLAKLSGRLRSARPHAVLAVDEEGGDVTRLDARTGSPWPGHLALGAVDDVDATRGVARGIGARLAACGVSLDLAPVADVNSDPRNPVIGVRSFGSDPTLVARHVAAFVRGLQEGGVGACAKHFPGHGDTSVDSHRALPRIDVDEATLRSRELVPFRAAVEAGADAVMTAHLVVPALDEQPATVSPRVLRVLRDELGFDGAIVSDALEMRGLADTVGVETGAVLALAAGVDALCVGHDLHEETVDALVAAISAAVEDGRLAEDRLAEAAGRVEALGRRERVPAAAAAADRTAAGRALRITGDVSIGAGPLVLELVPPPTVAAGPIPFRLGDAIRMRDPGSTVVELREGGDLGDLDGRPVVLALRDAGRYPWQQTLAERVVAARPDTVVVESGVPGWLPAGTQRAVETFGASRASLEAAAAALAPRS